MLVLYMYFLFMIQETCLAMEETFIHLTTYNFLDGTENLTNTETNTLRNVKDG